MLKQFNTPPNLLPNTKDIIISWYYDKQILLEIKEIALELVKLLPKNPNISYYGDVVSIQKIFQLMDEKINDESIPSVTFEFNDLKLEFAGRQVWRNPYRLIKTFVLTITYQDNIFSPFEIIKRLEKFPVISKVYRNEDFSRKQMEHQTIFLKGEDLNNSLLYPGYTKGSEIIDMTKNPGYGVSVEKFGYVGIGYYNEYSKPLVDAFGENVLTNALKKFNIPYKWENDFLKFQLFEDHRKSEFPENINLLVNLKKEIKYDQFLIDQDIQIISKEVFSILEDVEKAGKWIVERFDSIGIKLDYTLESLKEIDNFISKEFKKGKPVPGSIVENNVGSIVFALGIYLGDTLIKNSKSGKWLPNFDDIEDEINIMIEANDQFLSFPVKKIVENIKKPKEVSIYIYAINFLNLK